MHINLSYVYNDLAFHFASCRDYSQKRDEEWMEIMMENQLNLIVVVVVILSTAKPQKFYNTKPFCADSEQFVAPPRVSSPSPSTNSQKKERGIVWWGGTENSLIGECGLVVKLHRFSVPFFSSTSHNSLRPHKISSTFFPGVSPGPPTKWVILMRKDQKSTQHNISSSLTLNDIMAHTDDTGDEDEVTREKMAISSSFHRRWGSENWKRKSHLSDFVGSSHQNTVFLTAFKISCLRIFIRSSSFTDHNPPRAL